MKKIQFDFKKKSIAQLLFYLLVIVTICFSLFFNSIDLSWFQNNLHILRSYVNNNFVSSVLIFFFFRMFFAVVSIPGSGVLTIVAGAIFDFLIAAVLVTLSVSFGVLIVFLLSRYAFRDFLKEQFSDKFYFIDHISKNHGKSLLFLVRVTEVLPSFIINSFFAFTPIKASTYYWVSLFGLLPGILIFTNAGHQITEIQELSDLMTPNIMVSLGLIGVIPIMCSIFYKSLCKKYIRYNNKSVENEENELRKGFTTGSCATAAAKAALLAKKYGQYPEKVTILSPSGYELVIPIAGYGIREDHKNCAFVRKDGGDDCDSTHGILIGAYIKHVNSDVIKIRGGEGVGKVTKPGLPVDIGEKAINPVPKKMIRENTRDILSNGEGVEITIIVPEGKKIAKKTLNSKLGIINGISILGTTGIVEPMSEKALKDSLLLQLDQMQSMNLKTIVLVPGRMGEKNAHSFGIPKENIVITGNYIGLMLEKAAKRGFKRIFIMGHTGKIAKLSAGIFNTHSKVADARREIFVAHASLAGFSKASINRIWNAVTTEECVKIIENYDRLNKTHKSRTLFCNIANEAENRVQNHLKDNKVKRLGVAFTNRDGELIGFSTNSFEICYKEGWRMWEKLS
ncbi:cobalt-precorrin-5B (C(1))-methyltransferase CbiD [Natranaerobius trueperi]|uniref:Cobalt-precorrin-5B C(1)-methyltransferase n=1 Tax=Natranaerobius trueperi TaxID=759412 RepID=A0A226BVB0_9FIRM|nr:cobalt-precorrin-5B (C(1))-methyltransferase CbiD [Natranaerobius trueperi]OWZ82978.1 cobalamin biosynthesis protein CbiD [Natranaerobius trueperi]